MKRTVMLCLCLLTAFPALSDDRKPEPGLRLPTIFSTDMIIPAGTSTPVWGWALPDQDVTVTLGEQTVTTKAASDGKWKLALKNLTPDNKPLTLAVKSGEKTITCSNVLVGDVWFGCGQSNMAFPVKETLNAQKYLAEANYPNIRLFRTGIDWSEKPLEDVQGADHRQWYVCTPENVAGFGATLYYFGREVHDKAGCNC